MSDEEYEYDYGSDAEYDYGSDQDMNEDNGNSELIEVENSFYEGDDLRNENIPRAIELFERVVELETRLGDAVKWRFKALQHLVTLYFKTGKYTSMIAKYRAMLQFISIVTRNECTEAINTILDTITSATNIEVLSEMYEITLIALKTANNDRLWLNTNLKLAKLYLESHKIPEVERLLTALKSACQTPDGQDDIHSKGAFLLEIYCLEIQLCATLHDSQRMQQIYPKTVNLNTAVSDPRIMGIIREEGGKMMMSEGNFEDAYNELYEAFRNYQEAGNSLRAKDCLKYVVVVSMLTLSNINPFAAREAKVFSDDAEIVAMADLRQSLEANDLCKFEKIIKNPKHRIQNEPFLVKYLEPLRRRMREQVLLNLVRPYQTVTLSFLASELSLSIPEVEELLKDLIINEQLIGSTIDQPKGYLLLSASHMHSKDSMNSNINSSGSSSSHSLGSSSYSSHINTSPMQMVQDVYWLNTFNHFVQQFPDYS